MEDRFRQDGWSEDEDILLAETVLRYIREGGTQLEAFDELSKKLNRTPAAVGFRWNANVRRKYETAINIAKSYRLQNKRYKTKTKETISEEVFKNTMEDYQEEEKVITDNEITFDDVIKFLKKMSNGTKSTNVLEKRNERLEKENKELIHNYEQLKSRFTKLQSEYNTIKKDYSDLINIMERARRQVVFTDSTFNIDEKVVQ